MDWRHGHRKERQSAQLLRPVQFWTMTRRHAWKFWLVPMGKTRWINPFPTQTRLHTVMKIANMTKCLHYYDGQFEEATWMYLYTSWLPSYISLMKTKYLLIHQYSCIMFGTWRHIILLYAKGLLDFLSVLLIIISLPVLTSAFSWTVSIGRHAVN